MNPKNKTETQRPEKSKLRENIEAIVIAVILALFIRTFIVQAFKIPSGSMKNTLLIGDHLLVNKFIYGVKLPFSGVTIIPVKKPERGDIVVFKYPKDPSKDFIKRVVGIEGDEIKIRNKKVYVNDELKQPAYAIHIDPDIYPERDNFGPVTVPPDSLFVMGDNRDNSHDSRFWGFVNLKSVKGKAFILYWSWDSESYKGKLGWLEFWKWVRWKRFGHLLK